MLYFKHALLNTFCNLRTHQIEPSHLQPTPGWPRCPMPGCWPAAQPCCSPYGRSCAQPRRRCPPSLGAPVTRCAAAHAPAAVPAHTLPALPVMPLSRRRHQCQAALPQAAGCCSTACTAPCGNCCCAGPRRCAAARGIAAAGRLGSPAQPRCRHCWCALATAGWPAAAATSAAALGCCLGCCCRHRWCAVRQQAGSQGVVGRGPQ